MKKELVDYKEAIATLVLFSVGEFSILASGFSAKKDIWLSIIIATIVSFIMIIVYTNLLKLYPHNNYLDIIINIFGKKIGKIIIIVYAFFYFDITGLVALDGLNFIIVTAFDKTPRFLISTFFIFLCISVCRKGIGTLAKIAKVCFFLLYGYILISGVSLIPKADINNFRPLLYNGIRPVVKGAFDLLMYPYTEVLLFLIVVLHSYEVKKAKKILYSGLIVSAFYIFIISCITIMTIGENYASSATFPTYIIAKHIKIGFLKRGEILASTLFALGAFVKISIYLMATGMCIQKVFDLKSYKKILIPIGLLILPFQYFNFESVMSFNEYIFEIFVFYAFPFQIFSPIVFLIIGLLKKRLRHNKTKNI
ncbi:endospore germination permease [Clostridiaceae bacterium M8S5]|nr:endospore germination permease [Clostridiaceae bacterium M8S5]